MGISGWSKQPAPFIICRTFVLLGVEEWGLCYLRLDLLRHWNIPEKFLAEIRHSMPDVPILLAGLEADERNSKEVVEKLATWTMKPVHYLDGLMKARILGAAAYAECSALAGKGLDDSFMTANLLGRSYKMRKSPRERAFKADKKCALM
ncbi:uncharacterized protein KY384_000735 [Bacidia gigantensis]|uniref:uncharacterized protein n=1 Tax=Bacidia gigantensis TaxID=2732470 RepID=UPI001D0563FA|nr:uncharacterized protein KY384_000735 [Bacidia gigantensis]KAG8525973.1 hypothetical protein KY384_000735 [Bacidia gigantensis]